MSIRRSATYAQLRVSVVPGARRNVLERGPDGGFRVRVTSPPSEGRANKAVETLLAVLLDVPPTSVTVARGASSRNKTVHVVDLTTEQAIERLEELLGEAVNGT